MNRYFVLIIAIFLMAAAGAAIYAVKNYESAVLISPANNATNTQTDATPATPTPPTTQIPASTTPNPTPAPTPSPTSTDPGPTPSEIAYANRGKRQVVFTFDGGGVSDESAPAILTALAKHHIKGTFFLTGEWAQKFANTVRTINAAGHEIYNHTMTHPDLTTISDTQIRTQFRNAEAAISAITEKTTKPYFRPPFGARNQHVKDIAWQEGYRDVYWSTDAWDWREGWTDEMVKQRIMEGLTPGAIYLMHVGDGITGRVLDEMLTKIEAQGYSIVSLTQGLK